MATRTGKDLDELRALLGEAQALREDIETKGAELRREWGPAADGAASRAINLSHYISLRAHDLNDLQLRLAARGLSSLGRSEAKVAATLDVLIVTLRRLTGESDVPYPSATAVHAGASELDAESAKLFGKRAKGAPRVRVMATLPPEAAVSPSLVDDLIAAGMDCARINCAHDDAEAWGRMIENVRDAAARHERPCKILMDLGGPKCRILRVKAPPKARLARGDRATLIDELREKTRDPIAFSLNFPELVDQLAVGAEVFIDDGKAAARVIAKTPGRAEIEVYAAREKGVRLKPGKGVNFPSTELELPPLTSKDFRDLDFVARHADLVGFSFVQRTDDIELLQDHLVARAPNREPHGIVLKIETPLAVRNLPRLILQSAAHNPTAVMIARGDLAVELGFARLTEMQEEILWLCEAAHTPVVWATQVLDNYVRDGVASRAEMTDAATAQGAECVMLNKGPYLAEGVAFLRDVLARMDRHFSKKFARFGSLKAWS
ncbi:pyruvate kinase [Roseiarcus fermentans]|uniref:Pyruvate kinase n=1 Tax=Roseiarcus fermentans TaxID=1473586 RepID=A0A366EHY3_9HYPH|nr:pyruvate kinase [Roseiarcus fermentans]RBP01045.1 pyruvate kinase [Roseiarcus fermentans]